MSQVQLNVLVICICYFLRFVYDFAKLFSLEQFTRLRRQSVENNHSIYYSLFYFGLIFFVEFLPIVMFNMNMNIMYQSSITLTPKEQPLLNHRTTKSG